MGGWGEDRDDILCLPFLIVLKALGVGKHVRIHTTIQCCG